MPRHPGSRSDHPRPAKPQPRRSQTSWTPPTNRPERPDATSSSGLPPPAKKAKPAPLEEDSSSGSESDIEENSLQRELDKAKEACLDPLVHLYPAKLHGPLLRLQEKAIRVGAKRSVVERYKNLANFVLENPSKTNMW
ncbi:uncharacterized protein LOC118409247 [Branchiostoma floridae]|uniref:Uncharacterized protein LOC118409247 n=1 Tax=Branchiostoma floridae TaxID=7739 RepID=A0A9J7KLF1_BRAFL|nr:uncharacterized protein LOC118409247 [Branchiostoma floridae]